MTPTLRRARRREARELDAARRRYERAPPGYRLSRLKALRRKTTELLELAVRRAA